MYIIYFFNHFIRYCIVRSRRDFSEKIEEEEKKIRDHESLGIFIILDLSAPNSILTGLNYQSFSLNS